MYTHVYFYIREYSHGPSAGSLDICFVYRFSVFPSMDARAKKQRIALTLTQMRSSGVSTSAVSKILDKVRAHPEILQEQTNTTAINRALMAEFDKVSTTLDLPMDDESMFRWKIIAPQTALKLYTERPGAFRNLMMSVYAKMNSWKPLRLVVYSDEVTPGNVLRADNRRKYTTFYMSCLLYTSPSPRD